MISLNVARLGFIIPLSNHPRQIAVTNTRQEKGDRSDFFEGFLKDQWRVYQTAMCGLVGSI